jgi:uncharacterized protein YlxW (UPF0749 family)
MQYDVTQHTVLYASLSCNELCYSIVSELEGTCRSLQQQVDSLQQDQAEVGQLLSQFQQEQAAHAALQEAHAALQVRS